MKLCGFVVVLLPGLLLAGCQTKDDRLAAVNAEDDRTCLSYGAQKGTDAYIACRTNLATNRTSASAIRGTAPPGCTQFGNIINCR